MKEWPPSFINLFVYFLQNCLTHKDNTDKTKVVVKWRAPDKSQGPIDIK